MVDSPARDAFGLIPASAGQTTWAGWLVTSERAHPRECGADGGTLTLPSGARGSSPRVRGRPRLRGTMWSAVGLIPASAGQTSTPTSALPVRGAHPRECGADFIGPTSSRSGGGSSPRVRGRPAGGALNDGPTGLIPASAGQTPTGALRGKHRRAHPRECGADPSRPATLHQSKGLRSQLRRATY